MRVYTDSPAVVVIWNSYVTCAFSNVPFAERSVSVGVRLVSVSPPTGDTFVGTPTFNPDPVPVLAGGWSGFPLSALHALASIAHTAIPHPKNDRHFMSCSPRAGATPEVRSRSAHSSATRKSSRFVVACQHARTQPKEITECNRDQSIASHMNS
jgi:hypothetical protein